MISDTFMRLILVVNGLVDISYVAIPSFGTQLVTDLFKISEFQTDIHLPLLLLAKSSFVFHGVVRSFSGVNFSENKMLMIKLALASYICEFGQFAALKLVLQDKIDDFTVALPLALTWIPVAMLAINAYSKKKQE